MDEVFTLNRNAGVDVLHVEHPHERCNTDDAEDLRQVDAMTAEALLAGKHAVACRECDPRPQG